MPWQECSKVEERMRFVRDYEREEMTMAELCRFYGIARKTGYEMVERWREQGAEGLKDRSRSPLTGCSDRQDRARTQQEEHGAAASQSCI